MEHRIAFGGGDADVVVTVSGVATEREFKALYGELAADPRLRPGMRILLDYLEVDPSGLSADEVREISRHLASLEGAYHGASLAVVVRDALSFGLIRMGELTASFQSLTVHVTYSRDDAVAWLAERPEPGM